MKKTASRVFGFLSANMTIVYFLVILSFALIFYPNFANSNNIKALIRQAPMPIIRGLAVSFILVLGNVDLSLGYIVGFVSVTQGMLLDAGVAPALTILIGLAIGAAFGLVNGVSVATMRVPSFIVTLGSGYIFYGLVLIISNGMQYSHLDKAYRAFGVTKLFGNQLMIYYAILLTIAVFLLYRKTAFGRTLLATGLNQKAATMAGLRTKRALVLSFVIAGLLSSFSAILLTIRSNAAQTSLGGLGDFAFEGVTACVLGGTSLNGGKVNVFGIFLAALTIMIIENLITIIQINRYFYQPVLGVIILLAVLIDSIRSKRSHG